MQLSITMPDTLVPELDAYAEKLNLSRSAAITMMVSEYMRGLSAVDVVSKFVGMLEDFKKDGTLPSDEELKKIEEDNSKLV